MARARKGMLMSPNLAKWYEDKSAELGVTQSALMTMALNFFKNQQEALDMSKQFPELLAMLQELQGISRDNAEEIKHQQQS